MNKNPINDNLKCKWIKCSSQKNRVAEWIRKHDSHICCLQETHLKTKEPHRPKEKCWKIIFQAKKQEIKPRVAIVISDKIDFKTKAIKRDPEGHFIIFNGKTH